MSLVSESQFDSIQNNVPNGAGGYAGYIAGNPNWQTYGVFVREHPEQAKMGRVIPITPTASVHFRHAMLDVEAGDATIEQAGPWSAEQRRLWPADPVRLYAAVSNIQAASDSAAHSGVGRDHQLLMSAHTQTGRHLCTPGRCGFGLKSEVNCTQYNFFFDGINLDISEFASSWYPALKPVPNLHYGRYPRGPFVRRLSDGRTQEVNERYTVELYDHLRVHPTIHKVRLDALRANELLFLRKRVWYVANFDPTTGKQRKHPIWGEDWLGYRWNRLDARTKGEAVHS